MAELATSIVRVVEVPRSLLGEFLQMPEAAQVGLYFLIGDAAQGQQVYIGQTGSLGDHLSQHHAKKDFWNRALVAGCTAPKPCTSGYMAAT